MHCFGARAASSAAFSSTRAIVAEKCIACSRIPNQYTSVEHVLHEKMRGIHTTPPHIYLQQFFASEREQYSQENTNWYQWKQKHDLRIPLNYIILCVCVCAFSVREHTKKNLLFHYFDNSGIDIKSRNCGVVTRPTVMATGRLLVAFYFFVFFFVRIVGCFHCESTARNGGRVLAEDRGRTVMCGDRYWRTDNISAYLTVPHSQSDNVGACTHCLWRITD